MSIKIYLSNEKKKRVGRIDGSIGKAENNGKKNPAVKR